MDDWFHRMTYYAAIMKHYVSIMIVFNSFKRHEPRYYLHDKAYAPSPL